MQSCSMEEFALLSFLLVWTASMFLGVLQREIVKHNVQSPSINTVSNYKMIEMAKHGHECRFQLSKASILCLIQSLFLRP